MRGSVRQYARPGREPRWRARYLHPDPPPGKPTAQIERTFRTRAEADRWLRAQLAALDAGRHVAPVGGRMKFAALADAWRERWPGRLEPKTQEGYESILRAHLLPVFGPVALAEITTEQIESVLSGIAARRSVKTARNVQTAAHACFAVAVRRGWLPSNPASGAEVPRASAPAEKAWTILSPEQVAAVAEAMPTPAGRIAVYTAAYTGLRAGEQWGLDRSHYDGASLHVERAVKEVGGRLVLGPTKTRASRRLTLPAWLAAMLDEYLAPPPTLGPGEPLFLAPEGGRVRHGLFRRRQYRPAVRASLPPELHGVRWHDLRHTHASMLISAGAPITAVSARLGHASTRMTLDVYGHMMPGEDAALADRLPAPGAPSEAASGLLLPLRRSA